MAANNFPKVQGGGSLILAWQIRNKHVLVVGGGEVAAGRILNVLNADAHVTVVCPASGLNPEVKFRVENGEVAHIDRNFLPSDLQSLPWPAQKSPSRHHNTSDHATSSAAADASAAADQGTAETSQESDKGASAHTTGANNGDGDAGPPDMVLVAIDDPAASTQVWKLCKEHRIPANIADVPPECDFYFGSIHRDGPLQIMVSTNGRGPRLAANIRKSIAASLPQGVGDAISRVGALRARLRKISPDPADGPARMRWMSAVSDAYSWDDLAGLVDDDMANLLTFYSTGQVPEIDILKAMRDGRDPDDIDVFEGSFGFSLGI